MTVDVVIPAFGRPAQLAEAILSVLSQTHEDLRLTVVDDASPEPLAPQVAITDARLQFLRLSKNSGPGVARNLGAAAGRNPLIAFLDSDDLWVPGKLAKQIAHLRQNPACLWVHADEVWQRDGQTVIQRKEHRKQGGQFLVRAFERCLISASAVLFRRDFFETHGGFAAHFPLCEDFELWLRLLSAAPVGFIPEPLTIKRTGNWEQLSSAIGIDRFRVLALHRFYRQVRRDPAQQQLLEPLLGAAERKSRILAAGAQKYGHTLLVARYQAWLTLFKARRTLPIR